MDDIAHQKQVSSLLKMALCGFHASQGRDALHVKVAACPSFLLP